jgi:hypothetical protein
MSRRLKAGLAAAAIAGSALGQAPAPATPAPTGSVAHLGSFPVVELRRYALKPGARPAFGAYFETFFPDAFEQMGALALGHFDERGIPNGFTWLRGYPSMEARAVFNAAFYYGPLWREHRATLNALIDDNDNVILMRPLAAARSVPVLPAVDPVREPQGAQGVVLAQLFAVKPGKVDEFAAQAEAAFSAYRSLGLAEAGVLVTLDAPNNFPQLPVRSDGPWLLWMGLGSGSKQQEEKWMALAARLGATLASSGLLRGEPERIVLDPRRRSRLRYLPPAP